MPSALFAALFANARESDAALVVAGRTWRYGELRDAGEGVAARLWHLGVRPGDRVATLYRDHADSAIALLASWRIGAIHVPIDVGERALLQVRRLLELAGTRALLVESAFQPWLERLSDLVPPEATLVSPDGGSLADEAGSEGALEGADVGDDDVGMITFTSGSTGEPKGVVLTQGAVRAEIQCGAAGRQLTAADRQLGTSELGCNPILMGLAGTLYVGGTFLVEPFDPPRVLDVIERAAITCVSGSPSRMQALIDEQLARPRRVGSLRRIAVGGDKPPVRVLEEGRRAFGRALVQVYGMTEVGMCFTTPAELPPDKRGSCGVPWPGTEVRVVDDDGEGVPAGEEGEFLFRTPSMMTGYWNSPEATAARLRDGWFWSMDVGRRDADGFYYFTGRKSDFIKTADADKLSIHEIEAALAAHPAVREVAAVGVRWPGEPADSVVACVTLREGAVLPGRDAMDVFLRDRLPDVFFPRAYHVLPELPRTPSAKVDRKRLRELAVPR